MQGKAQVSLEYLLLLAVLFASLAAISPKLIEAYNAMAFAGEVQNAKSFCQRISSTIEKMGYFENSSSESIKAFPQLQWTLKASGNEVRVEVESKALQRIKELKCKTGSAVEGFEGTFAKAFGIRVQKANGKVSIIDN